MEEPRKIVVILGNGFDVDLGLKTLYKDFWESKYCPKDYPAPLIFHLNSHGIDTKGKSSPDGRLLEYLENRIIARGIVDALTARGLDAGRDRLQEPVSRILDFAYCFIARRFVVFNIFLYFCELKVMHNTTMGLQNQLLLDLYKDKASVFTMQGIAMAYGQGLDRDTVKSRMIGYVKKGEILNPRKGIYAKPGYDEKELACLLYTPSYISLEYVLQRAGIVFQYSDEITSVGNLSRSVEIDGKVYRYRKIKGEILIDTTGIIREGNVNIASPERAFLDTLYLDSNYYFDNPSSLDKQKVLSLLPIYNSKTLEQRVSKILG